MVGKIWMVFAGWAGGLAGLFNKVFSYNMEHSIHALMLTLRYFNFTYEVCFYLRGN
jgi:hypothetical protein